MVDYSAQTPEYVEAALYGTDSYRNMMDLSPDPHTNEIVDYYKAMLSIGEIEGVGAMMTTMTEQLTEQFMGKKPARGIRMDIQDGEITLDVYLTVKYGFAIPETAAKVQDAVMSAVETMTGFSVRAVNVHVGGISFN